MSTHHSPLFMAFSCTSALFRKTSLWSFAAANLLSNWDLLIKMMGFDKFFHEILKSVREIEKRSKPCAVIWKICKYLSRNTFSSWVLIFVNSSSTCFSRSLSIKWLLSVSALEFAISLALSRTFSTWVARSSFSLTSRNCSWFSLTSEASLASISSLSWSNWWLRTRSFPLRSAISSCASVKLLARPMRKEEYL